MKVDMSKQKTFLTFFLTLTLGVPAIILILALINHYYYSWAGVMANKVGLCERKNISVPGENGHPVNLSFLMDLKIVSSSISTNPHYDIVYYPTSLSISRVYDNVRYSLIFNNFQNERRGFVTNFDMSFFLHKSGEKWGESYKTANYQIEQNIYAMIDDLPVSVEQKTEMKNHVRISCEWNFKMPL